MTGPHVRSFTVDAEQRRQPPRHRLRRIPDPAGRDPRGRHRRLRQALPSQFDRTPAAYWALEKLLADGKVRVIGVSNFKVEHLTRLLDTATVVPAINQIEVHP
jgi:hypothetical protein